MNQSNKKYGQIELHFAYFLPTRIFYTNNIFILLMQKIDKRGLDTPTYRNVYRYTFTTSSTFLEVFTRLIDHSSSVSVSRDRLYSTAQEYQLYLPIFSKRADIWRKKDVMLHV